MSGREDEEMGINEDQVNVWERGWGMGINEDGGSVWERRWAQTGMGRGGNVFR